MEKLVSYLENTVRTVNDVTKGSPKLSAGLLYVLMLQNEVFLGDSLGIFVGFLGAL